MEIAFIYNELNKDGNFKSIYYDGTDPKHISKIKFVEDQNRRILDISSVQQEEIHTIVNSFIGGNTDYSDNGNEEIDHFLLVSSEDGLQRVKYYYWKNDENAPKGVERLLEFLEKIRSSD